MAITWIKDDKWFKVTSESEMIAWTPPWNEGIRCWTDDTHKLYVWTNPSWIAVSGGGGGGGMAQHGNEWHIPDFEQAGAVNTHANLTTNVHGVGAGTIAKIDDINIDTNLSTAAQDAISKRHSQNATNTSSEPANANIQAHVTSAHAPANAQKNSDILKSEIEAKLTGEITSHTHPSGGGGSELWEGKVHIAMFDGSPLDEPFMAASANATISPTVTPTNIGTTIGRIVAFRFKTAITVTTIRWYGIGGVSNIYTSAIYRDSDGARLWSPGNISTSANTWSNNTAGGLPLTFAADTLYWFGIGANATGTTAGFVTPPMPRQQSFGLATPAWAGMTTIGWRFCQVALTAGAWPTTLPAKANAAAWTGFIPMFYLCASGY